MKCTVKYRYFSRHSDGIWKPALAIFPPGLTRISILNRIHTGIIQPRNTLWISTGRPHFLGNSPPISVNLAWLHNIVPLLSPGCVIFVPGTFVWLIEENSMWLNAVIIAGLSRNKKEKTSKLWKERSDSYLVALDFFRSLDEIWNFCGMTKFIRQNNCLFFLIIQQDNSLKVNWRDLDFAEETLSRPMMWINAVIC